jgi:antitoxin MazE
MYIKNSTIVLQPFQKKVREGWAEASKKIAQANDDELVWPEFNNEDDKKLSMVKGLISLESDKNIR